jgi:CcmD family protein
MNSYSFLFWAYNVVWGAIAAYVLFLGIRLRRVGRRLERMEHARRDDD